MKRQYRQGPLDIAYCSYNMQTDYLKTHSHMQVPVSDMLPNPSNTPQSPLQSSADLPSHFLPSLSCSALYKACTFVQNDTNYQDPTYMPVHRYVQHLQSLLTVKKHLHTTQDTSILLLLTSNTALLVA